MKGKSASGSAFSRRRFFLWAVLILIFFGAIYTAWTLTSRHHGSMYNASELDSVQKQPVAIVFGAGYGSSGRVSAVLRDRLDAAIELYRAGRVEKLLFSGDNRVQDYNEPARMQEYALAQGLPQEDLVLDFAGRRTYDTCYRARDIFKVSEAILVTQRYHLPRAITTCSGLGLDVIGYIADRTSYVRIRWYQFREIPALWRTWWDLYLAHPTPVLGDPLPIFPE